MSASLIVCTDNLAGQIKLEKHGAKVIVGESNISKVIANRDNDVIMFSSSDEVLDKLTEVLMCVGFTSRYIGKDMYDNKIYDYRDEAFKQAYIYGIQDKYDVPAGIVMYHVSNELLFQCTNIEFMITNKIISFKYTNIKNKIYLVKRSDGSLQDTCIIPNGGLYLKNDSLRINHNFSSEPREKLNPGVLNDYQKAVHVTEFCDINNIKIEVKLPYFNESVIESQETHMKEVLIYYNTKLSKFSKFISENFGDLLTLV
jgi:hypothetical protein